jgi:hypothetical protein
VHSALPRPSNVNANHWHNPCGPLREAAIAENLSINTRRRFLREEIVMPAPLRNKLLLPDAPRGKAGRTLSGLCPISCLDCDSSADSERVRPTVKKKQKRPAFLPGVTDKCIGIRIIGMKESFMPAPLRNKLLLRFLTLTLFAEGPVARYLIFAVSAVLIAIAWRIARG